MRVVAVAATSGESHITGIRMAVCRGNLIETFPIVLSSTPYHRHSMAGCRGSPGLDQLGMEVGFEFHALHTLPYLSHVR